MEPIAAIPGPGTIDDLVADAAGAGHRVTRRMVHDWVAKGLINSPERRREGPTGSLKALHSLDQRVLFFHLSAMRAGGASIRDLAEMVIRIWFSLDDCVPTRQALKALQTWVGEPRSSLVEARRLALMHTEPFTSDRRLGTARDRRDLLRVVSDVFYTGRVDRDLLEEKSRPIFEPREQFISVIRSHNTTAVADFESLVILLETITRAGQSVKDGTVTEALLDQAGALIRHYVDTYSRPVGMADLLTVLSMFAVDPDSRLGEMRQDSRTISVII